MKKSIIIIFLATLSLLSYSQKSSSDWNSSTAKYTNSFHKITWQLDENLEWIERPILSESTLFKMRNDDTHIMVKFGANKGKGLKGDIWSYISELSAPQSEELHKQLAKQNGMKYLGTKTMKSQLCGNHAIKKRIDMKKDYPEYNQTVHSIEIEYIFYKGDYIYTVSVMALSVLEEEIGIFEKIATQLFNGFDIK